MALDVETPGLDRARGVQTPPSWRALGYWAYSYKRTWRGSVATSFLIPVLYLAAMGVGLGSLVDQHSHTVDHVKYLYFLAPGLLASTAMQIGTNEATYPVMGAIKWIRTYFAMLATPLSVNNVLLGTLSWIAIRLTLVSAIYLCVLTGFGAALSPLALLALPAAVLTGLAFSAPIAAFAATVQNDTWFSSIYRFGVVPLFLSRRQLGYREEGAREEKERDDSEAVDRREPGVVLNGGSEGRNRSGERKTCDHGGGKREQRQRR